MGRVSGTPKYTCGRRLPGLSGTAGQPSVLILMFQPGGNSALKTIRDLSKAKPALYVRGVVSTLPTDAADERTVKVDLQMETKKQGLALDVVQPRGVNAVANWAATVARSEFLTMQGGVIGFAIVHSKVIVIDPFTNPVVITGSHNFSGNASTANDENFVIVRNNPGLAASYAAHTMGVYDHYGERLASKNSTSLSGYLATSDTWLDRKRVSASPELAFWTR